MKPIIVEVINVTDPEHDNNILFTGIFDDLRNWLSSKVQDVINENDIKAHEFLALSNDGHVVQAIKHYGYKTTKTIILVTPEQLYTPPPDQYEMKL